MSPNFGLIAFPLGFPPLLLDLVQDRVEYALISECLERQPSFGRKTNWEQIEAQIWYIEDFL